MGHSAMRIGLEHTGVRSSTEESLRRVLNYASLGLKSRYDSTKMDRREWNVQINKALLSYKSAPNTLLGQYHRGESPGSTSDLAHSMTEVRAQGLPLTHLLLLVSYWASLLNKVHRR